MQHDRKAELYALSVQNYRMPRKIFEMYECKKYSVLYRVNELDKVVEILRIVHATVDITKVSIE